MLNKTFIALIALQMSACSFDENGEIQISNWFIFFIVLFIGIIIVAGVNSSKKTAEVNKELAKRGIKREDFIKCGTYVGGHPSLNNTVEGIHIRKAEGNLSIYDFLRLDESPRYIADIPIDKISTIDIEDASSIERKITVGRLFLVGIFAFAWKKKKKNELAFVTIVWKEKFEHTTIFSFEGQNAMQNANTARNKLIELCS